MTKEPNWASVASPPMIWAMTSAASDWEMSVLSTAAWMPCWMFMGGVGLHDVFLGGATNRRSSHYRRRDDFFRLGNLGSHFRFLQRRYNRLHLPINNAVTVIHEAVISMFQRPASKTTTPVPSTAVS